MENGTFWPQDWKASLKKAKSSPNISGWLLIKRKIVSCNIFAITAAVKNRENPFDVSTAARENLCEANTAAIYQENQEKAEHLELSNE